MPNGGNVMNLKAFHTGECASFDFLSKRGGRFSKVMFPALAFLFEHRGRNILFDTGYSEHFFKASNDFPYRLYRYATPVTFSHEQSLKVQLEEMGIQATEIDTIILSHFHGDHTGGLKDFPNAKIITSAKAWQHAKHRTGFRAVKQAHLPDTIPENFEHRVEFIEKKRAVDIRNEFDPFEIGFDIFEDGSVIAIFLEGHAVGQFGIIFGNTFLCADAVWSRGAIENELLPSRVASLIMPSARQYETTFQKLTQFARKHPEVKIIPSHCTEVAYE